MVFDCECILQTTIYGYFSMVKYAIEIFKELFRCADNKRFKRYIVCNRKMEQGLSEGVVS